MRKNRRYRIISLGIFALILWGTVDVVADAENGEIVVGEDIVVGGEISVDRESTFVSNRDTGSKKIVLASSNEYKNKSMEVEIIVDGEPMEVDGPVMNVDGMVIVPMRAVFEALGARVDWQPSTRTVRAVKAGQTVQLTIDEKTAFHNGKPIELSVPGQIVNGRTLVPLRFVSESVGAYVHWNGSERVISISSDGTPQTYPSNYVHINVADIDALTRIIHISTARAEHIIRLREEKKFESYDDLMRIPGIGEVRVRQIREQGLIRF